MLEVGSKNMGGPCERNKKKDDLFKITSVTALRGAGGNSKIWCA